MVIVGYSYIFKSFIKNEDSTINNLDLLYGLFILIFLSLVLNFIQPLKNFFYITILVGFISFIIAYFRKKIKINFIYHLIIIFAFIFIIYSHGDNEDSPMYHLQIIKWLYNYKISFGLTNLEIRFGDSSLWFNFLSLFQYKLKYFNSIHTLNIIPFSIITYEIFKLRKTLSYLFLNLSLSFLFFFSFLHPFRNGIILNHLHNPEVDTVAMIFFFTSFYLMLKFFEEKKREIFNLLILSSSICVVIKISYIGVVLLPIVILFLFYRNDLNKFLKIKLNIILIIFFILWFLKNFLISGCFIFPVSPTCFNVDWSSGTSEIDNYSKAVKGFARDTRARLRYLDFEHTIYSFNWFMPWLRDYAFNTALLKISGVLISITVPTLILLNKFSRVLVFPSNDRNKIFYTFLILVINLLIWFQAPEIRFGWGTIISVNCYLISILLFYSIFFKKINPNIYKYFTLFFIIILIFDNQKNLNIHNLKKPYFRNFNYSQVEKIYDLNGRGIYHSKNRKCYDFSGICVNVPKKKYFYKEKLGYLIFMKN
jgi:hypothetical protein